MEVEMVKFGNDDRLMREYTHDGNAIVRSVPHVREMVSRTRQGVAKEYFDRIDRDVTIYCKVAGCSFGGNKRKTPLTASKNPPRASASRARTKGCAKTLRNLLLIITRK